MITQIMVIKQHDNRVSYAQPLLVPTMEGSGTGGSVSPTLAAPAEPPTLLGPGEVIKPSGKFPKPTKIPGKNYSKDEVVIRNADSGKGNDQLSHKNIV